jgi:hypothetical protein
MVAQAGKESVRQSTGTILAYVRMDIFCKELPDVYVDCGTGCVRIVVVAEGDNKIGLPPLDNVRHRKLHRGRGRPQRSDPKITNNAYDNGFTFDKRDEKPEGEDYTQMEH